MAGSAYAAGSGTPSGATMSRGGYANPTSPARTGSGVGANSTDSSATGAQEDPEDGDVPPADDSSKGNGSSKNDDAGED